MSPQPLIRPPSSIVLPQHGNMIKGELSTILSHHSPLYDVSTVVFCRITYCSKFKDNLSGLRYEVALCIGMDGICWISGLESTLTLKSFAHPLLLFVTHSSMSRPMIATLTKLLWMLMATVDKRIRRPPIRLARRQLTRLV